jgi:hypothetical protein
MTEEFTTAPRLTGVPGSHRIAQRKRLWRVNAEAEQVLRFICTRPQGP